MNFIVIIPKENIINKKSNLNLVITKYPLLIVTIFLNS